ncbi:MAG: hypothetical protein AB7F86_10640 [Bdellovibrionales bacterium]
MKDLNTLSYSAYWKIFRVLLWTQLWLLKLLIIIIQLSKLHG